MIANTASLGALDRLPAGRVARRRAERPGPYKAAALFRLPGTFIAASG
jgi:hypothetical protein